MPLSGNKGDIEHKADCIHTSLFGTLFLLRVPAQGVIMTKNENELRNIVLELKPHVWRASTHTALVNRVKSMAIHLINSFLTDCLWPLKVHHSVASIVSSAFHLLLLKLSDSSVHCFQLFFSIYICGSFYIEISCLLETNFFQHACQPSIHYFHLFHSHPTFQPLPSCAFPTLAFLSSIIIFFPLLFRTCQSLD